MPGFFQRLSNVVKTFFEYDELSTTETGTHFYEDTDTTDINDCQGESSHNSNTPEQTINDEDYWWCFEGHPKESTPVFEAIDDQEVTKELNRRIDNDEFPVIEIPDNVMKTMQILNNPNFNYAEVANLINHSPAMAGEFIKVLNTSLYSRGVVINDLKMALPRLGRDNIKALLYMYSSKLSFASNPLFNDFAVRIVDHSYATGLISAYLSQRFYPDPDGAFLAGLLHNIGKLGILKAISEIYDLPKSINFKLSEEVFDSIFPQLYEKAGKFLASNWKVNDTVICAIEHHNDFLDVGFTEDNQLAFHLCEITNLSSTMARMLGHGQHIGPTNIFSLPATIDMAIERDHSTVEFLEDIPKMVSFKSKEDISQAV